MDGVQLPQGYSHFEEAILSTSEGWKAASTLEPPSGFEHGTPELGIQRLNKIYLTHINPLLYFIQ